MHLAVESGSPLLGSTVVVVGVVPLDPLVHLSSLPDRKTRYELPSVAGGALEYRGALAMGLAAKNRRSAC